MPINKIGSMDGSRPADPTPDPRRSQSAAQSVSRTQTTSTDMSRLAPRDVVSLSAHAVSRGETEKYLAILRKRQDVRARRVQDLRARLEAGSLLDPESARRVAREIFRAEGDAVPGDDELREL